MYYRLDGGFDFESFGCLAGNLPTYLAPLPNSKGASVLALMAGLVLPA